MKALFTICAVAALMSACGQMYAAEQPGDSLKQEKADDTWSDAEVDSENLSDEAEQLLSLDTIDQALGKFNEALKLNPKNGRADVWVAVIKAELELKGILARVRPFIESMPRGDWRYDRLVQATNEQNDAQLRQFYLTGPNDIHNALEFQEWVDRVDMRLGELRDTLDRHKNEELTLLVPMNLFGGIPLGGTEFNGTKKCQSQHWGPIKYQPSDCNATSAEFRMNRADMDALNVGIAMYEASIAVLNAYRISDKAIATIEEHVDDDLDVFGTLVKDGAQLRSSNRLGMIDKGLRDVALSARYILDHQKQTCARGHESRTNRPGYIFAYGICFNASKDNDDYARTVRMIDQVINRQPVSIFDYEAQGGPSLDFDFAKFTAQPLADLGVLAPASRNACGTIVRDLTPLDIYATKGKVSGVFKPYCPAEAK